MCFPRVLQTAPGCLGMSGMLEAMKRQGQTGQPPRPCCGCEPLGITRTGVTVCVVWLSRMIIYISHYHCFVSHDGQLSSLLSFIIVSLAILFSYYYVCSTFLCCYLFSELFYMLLRYSSFLVRYTHAHTNTQCLQLDFDTWNSYTSGILFLLSTECQF